MPNEAIEKADRKMTEAQSYYNGAQQGRTGSLKSCVYALMTCVRLLLTHLKDKK